VDIVVIVLTHIRVDIYCSLGTVYRKGLLSQTCASS
jgi:hypothetical protein